MRRRNIFPDPGCAGMMHPYANDGTRSDFVKNEGMMWMRATTTAVGTRQNYAQYSLTADRVPAEGTYHVRLLAHAEGGDGMAHCYVRQPDSTYLPCYTVNIPDGQTIVIERAIGVPAGCGELIVRICPAAVVGATAMMSRISIEAADTYEIASGGGASGLLHRRHRTVLAPSRLVVGRENRESMAGPALRKQGRHLECDTGICHHSEERRPLGIHHTQWRILHPEAEVRMHDDAAQPAQLMGLHTSGAGGYAAHGEWGLRHGHHQRRSKEYCWHPCDCRYQDHGDGHVRRRSGRMADTAGGGSARLRSRHRPLLAPSLGVAA